MNHEQSVALYDMTAIISITPVGAIDQEHVELKVNGELVGEYPTYTEACETLIRGVNDSF